MYMSEFCCYVLLNFWRRSPAICPWNPEELGTRDWPSRNWNRRSLWVAAPKSLVYVEYEKLLENYLGAQGTFNPNPNPRPHLRTVTVITSLSLTNLGSPEICIQLYVYPSTYLYMYTHTHTHLYIYTHTHTHTYIYIYKHTHTHIYIYIYIYIYISVSIYLYIYLSIYICVNLPSGSAPQRGFNAAADLGFVGFVGAAAEASCLKVRVEGACFGASPNSAESAASCLRTTWRNGWAHKHTDGL